MVLPTHDVYLVVAFPEDSDRGESLDEVGPAEFGFSSAVHFCKSDPPIPFWIFFMDLFRGSLPCRLQSLAPVTPWSIKVHNHNRIPMKETEQEGFNTRFGIRRKSRGLTGACKIVGGLILSSLLPQEGLFKVEVGDGERDVDVGILVQKVPLWIVLGHWLLNNQELRCRGVELVRRREQDCSRDPFCPPLHRRWSHDRPSLAQC